MDSLEQRVAELERKLAGALGANEEHHPELIAKELAALRGKVSAMYEFAQELDLRLQAVERAQSFHAN